MIHIRSKGELEALLASQKLVLVDFYADWCGPCKMMDKVLTDLDYEYSGDITILKVNIEDLRDLAEEHEVQSVPTFKIYHRGTLMDSVTGFKPKGTLSMTFTKFIN